MKPNETTVKSIQVLEEISRVLLAVGSGENINMEITADSKITTITVETQEERTRLLQILRSGGLKISGE